MSEKKFLQIPLNAVQNLRKLYNLDGPGRLEEAINILENWINQQSHILKKDFSKEYLERVLIASKGSIEKSKKRLDALCTMRTLTPQLFNITNTKAEFQEVFNLAHLFPLPVPTKDLYRIFLFKISYSAFSQQQLIMVLQYFILMADYMSRNEYLNGFIFVDDFQGLNVLEFISKLVKPELQQCLSILLKGFGTRIQSIRILSQSKFADVLVNFIKSFLSPKIANRISVHKTSDDLFSYVPKEIFPVEYGGKERDINTLMSDWLDTLFAEKNLNIYNQMKAACTDESLRSLEKFNNEYLGMAGSIRKLTVD